MSSVVDLGAARSTLDLERAKAELDAHGYCIIENVLSRGEIAALNMRLIEQASGERASGFAFHDG